MRTFDIVVAADAQRGIGINGKLPWQLPGDMAYFKELTATARTPERRNAVIMGRKTWESIPARFRPLSNRLNIVLSRDAGYALPESVLKASSLEHALALAQKADVESIFVIGGAQLYAEALLHPSCRRIYFTDIKQIYHCDAFLPEFSERFELLAEEQAKIQQDGQVQYIFQVYGVKDN